MADEKECSSGSEGWSDDKIKNEVRKAILEIINEVKSMPTPNDQWIYNPDPSPPKKEHPPHHIMPPGKQKHVFRECQPCCCPVDIHIRIGGGEPQVIERHPPLWWWCPCPPPCCPPIKYPMVKILDEESVDKLKKIQERMGKDVSLEQIADELEQRARAKIVAEAINAYDLESKDEEE